MGSLAARGVADSDWPCVWEAVFVNLLSGVAAWRDPPLGAAALAVASGQAAETEADGKMAWRETLCT